MALSLSTLNALDISLAKRIRDHEISRIEVCKCKNIPQRFLSIQKFQNKIPHSVL